MTDEPEIPGDATRPPGAMAQLSHQELLESQALTLATPRRAYGAGARILFALLDVIYGKARTLSKFKVLELVARVPYQSWEQVAYIAITHTSARPDLARRIFERVSESRRQEDNEQWHLLMIQELIGKEGIDEGFVKFTIIPQAIAFVYYQVSWLLYVIRPRLSYQLNADFEDHAEHEYAHLVQENPSWEGIAFESAFANDYATIATRADLFRQIGYDERVHKQESLDAMERPRFH